MPKDKSEKKDKQRKETEHTVTISADAADVEMVDPDGPKVFGLWYGITPLSLIRVLIVAPKES